MILRAGCVRLPDDGSALYANRRSNLKKILLAAAIGLLTSAAFAVTFVPLSGEISVKTSPDRRNAAVTVFNKGVVSARFCLSFLEPLEEPIDIDESGQVIYLPRPIEGVPPGAQIEGPEPIAQTLTVIPVKGRAFAFVAEGVKPIYGNAQTILIESVARQDRPGDNGARMASAEICWAVETRHMSR